MEKDKKLNAIDAVNFVNKELEKKESIIEGGILPQNSIAIVGGISKIGKSILVSNMAVQMATAKPFLQFNIPKPKKVIYLQAEISEQSMQNRLRKMLDSIDYDIEPDMLFIVNRKNIKLNNPKDLRMVENLIKSKSADVLIIDPLYKFHSGDENKVNDMTRFFDRIDWLVAQNNISIVLVHHFGKPQEGRDGATQFRGSSAIVDYGDSYLMLRRKSRDESRDYMKLSFELRNDEEPDTMILYRNSDTLWYEVQGVEGNKKVNVHDCIACLEEMGGITKSKEKLMEKIKERTGASEKTIKGALKEAERLKMIFTARAKGKGAPKICFLPSMKSRAEDMIEVGITPTF